MPESRQIPSQTTLSVVGSVITITTRYHNEDQGGVVFAFISQIVGGEAHNGVGFIEGEGGIIIDDSFNLDFNLDASSGELIVTAPDAAQYSIDTNTGQLVYTY